MKYLTRIEISRIHALANGISDLYQWHRFVWRLFPGQETESRNFLFRIDDKKNKFIVYLLSVINPSFPDWCRGETKRISENFLKKKLYLFRIRLNPTMRRKSDRRRIGIYQEDKLRKWFENKAKLSGFSIEADKLQISQPINNTFRKEDKEGKLNSVDFAGILKVDDGEKFRKAYNVGIGSAKSFGFGLFLLKAIR